MNPKTTVKYIFLSGQDRDLVLFLLSGKGQFIKYKFFPGGATQEKFLIHFARLMIQYGSQIRGLIISQQGSFSRLRLLCTAVNALAYVNHWRLALVTAKDYDELWLMWPKLVWQNKLHPVYSVPAV